MIQLGYALSSADFQKQLEAVQQAAAGLWLLRTLRCSPLAPRG